MSDPDPNNPFGMFGGMFGDLSKMFQNQGPVNWDAARQIAHTIGTEASPSPNVDPIDRIALEELARVAEMHLDQATTLALDSSGSVRIEVVSRTQWIERSLEGYKSIFEKLGAGMSSATATGAADDPMAGGDPMAAMLGPLMKMVEPVMLGMSVGSIVGHLSTKSLGQYDLPLPRSSSASGILILHSNIADFASEWSVPIDEVRLWVLLHEIAHHAVLSVPHVQERLMDLIASHSEGFEANPRALEEKFGAIDLSDPASLASLSETFSDPQALLGAVQSDRQREILPHIDAVVSVIVGYVDFLMDRVGGPLIGSYERITEALRRRRVESGPQDSYVEKLFGLNLTRAHYERSEAFIGGVVERAGADALEQLWASPSSLPTPAEVDAPGLWLARLGIDVIATEDIDDISFEVPDYPDFD